MLQSHVVSSRCAKKFQPRQARPVSFRLAAGVPGLALPPRFFPERQTNNRERTKLPIDTYGLFKTRRAANESLCDVESPTFPAGAIAPQHRALAEAAPALAPASSTRAIDGEYGGSGESDEDDGGAGAGYAGVGRVCWRIVSPQCATIGIVMVRLLIRCA